MIITGWIGNDRTIKDSIKYKVVANDKKDIVITCAKTKDTRYDWSDESWPPRKVKITIEEVK